MVPMNLGQFNTVASSGSAPCEQRENELLQFYGDRLVILAELFLVMWFLTTVATLGGHRRGSRHHRRHVRPHIPRPGRLVFTLLDKHICAMRR